LEVFYSLTTWMGCIDENVVLHVQGQASDWMLMSIWVGPREVLLVGLSLSIKCHVHGFSIMKISTRYFPPLPTLLLVMLPSPNTLKARYKLSQQAEKEVMKVQTPIKGIISSD